ncbi:radical SAM protein, partial [Candidatus Bathyarchaeota archaeon]|nr:radical SAM protein [Candidatus Bathyarchaeota archaeon]
RIRLVEDLLKNEDQLHGYDVLLVSGMTPDLPAVRRMIRTWRRGGGGPVIVGGPIASDPWDALARAGGDIAVIGEGEQTLQELLDLGILEGAPLKEGLGEVKGVAYMEGDSVRVNPLRPFMRRGVYDSYMPSTERIVDYPLYRAARVYVEVLRGCSNYRRAMVDEMCRGCRGCVEGPLTDRYGCPVGIPPGCGYCSVPSLYGPPRSRSIRKILDEVRRLTSLGARRIVLSAPDFLDYGRDLLVEPEPLTDPAWPEPNYEELEGLLSTLTGIDAFQEGEASLMVENVKGCLVTEKAAEILGKYLGGTPINIGLETGSEEHSWMLGRPSTPKETLRAVERLRRAGLRPYVYFIHGLPGQSMETARLTVEAIHQCVKMGAERIILYRFQPLPMSAYGDNPAPPPANKDRNSSVIKKASEEANRRLKKEMVGKRLRVVLAEPYQKNRRLRVAYPLDHGPVVLLEVEEGDIGDILEIAVTRVLSDRMVEGKPIK